MPSTADFMRERIAAGNLPRPRKAAGRFPFNHKSVAEVEKCRCPKPSDFGYEAD